MFIENLNILNFNFKKHMFQNIELDAITAQDITLENIISEHPLETGELLNDAIHNLPIRLSFSAVVSDLAQNYQEELESISNTTESVFTNKKLHTSKAIRAWQDLYSLYRSKELVSITTPIQTFKPFSQMAIKDITVSLDNTYSLNFSVNLQEVMISENLKKINLSSEVGKQSERP